MARSRWWGKLPTGSLMLAAAWLSLLPSGSARADETEAERQARIEKMSNEEKGVLLGKQARFDALEPEEKQRLYDLHAAITHDPAARQLEDTVRHYNKWLANLSAGQRGAIVAIVDPKTRIEKIKELMEHQQKERFTQFVQEEFHKEDRDAVYEWMESFVGQHQAEILQHLPSETRRQLEEITDETARRRACLREWQRRRRDPEMPAPAKSDFDQLFEKLSAEARGRITASAKADQRDQRLAELVRAASFSRATPPSREELVKFYMAMDKADPRRERLEGLDENEVYRELQRMHWQERFGPRGGPGGDGGRGRRGGGGPDGGGFGGPGGKGPPPQRGERPEPPPGGRGEPKGPPPDKAGRGDAPPSPPMP